MRSNEVIELGNITETIEFGEVISTVTYRSVFANQMTLSLNESFEAKSLGLKPKALFQIRTTDFNNDEKARWNGIEYSILNTRTKGEYIEITIGALSNG